MGNMTNKETVKDWILKQRLQNYGYDYKWFRRMSGHKAKTFKALRQVPDKEVRKSLAKVGILGKGRRLTRSKGVVNYTVGQSFNEELLNMAILGATKGQKSFWDFQEKWG